MSKQRFEYTVCPICHQHSVWLGDCKNPNCGKELAWQWDYARAVDTADALMGIFKYKREVISDTD